MWCSSGSAFSGMTFLPSLMKCPFRSIGLLHTVYIHRPDCVTPCSVISEFNVLEEHSV